MTAFLIESLVIALGHCIGGVLLYRGRIISQVPILQSDFLVFLLPSLLALIAYGAAYWCSGFFQARPVMRIATMIGLSILMSGLSAWLSMSVAFTRYGT